MAKPHFERFEHCPTCYAADAVKQLDQHRALGGGAFERAGRAAGMLDTLARTEHGWRFCADHACSPSSSPPYGA